MHNFYKSQLLALIYSWAFALIFIILGGSFYSPLFYVFYIIYTWSPAFVALQFYHQEKIRVPLNLKWNSSYIWPILIATSLFLFNVVLILPFSSIRSFQVISSFFPAFFNSLTSFTLIFLSSLSILVLSIIGGCSLFLFAYFGPELMWRGYGWDKLKMLGFWRAALMLGFFHGLWKAPLILMGLNYPFQPYWGVIWQIIYSMSLSPLLLYYRLKTQSILGAALFISVFFAFNEFLPILFVQSQSLYTGSLGMVDILAINIFNVLLFLKVRKNVLLEYEI